MVHRTPEARTRFFKKILREEKRTGDSKRATSLITDSIMDRVQAMQYTRGIALRWLRSLGLKKLNCEKILDMKHQAETVLPILERLITTGNAPKLRESLAARVEERKIELKTSHSERRKDITAEIAILSRLLKMLSTEYRG